jgi:hypothetical protein
MSHGKLDLSGSKIFGPYTMNARRADYGVTLDRNGLLNLAKSTALASGVPLSNFAGVCVSFLGQVDLCGWVGGMAAFCDTLSLEPSVLGQEMGHGYGLNHARLNGSTTDYQDPWDVMSTWDSAYMQSNPEFTLVGPAINAWNMRGQGWLDETRVWNPPAPVVSEVIQLRPLHRTDLPGFLAAQVGEYLVEFRVPQSWDAAIPRACVLVHRFEDQHSYLMPAASGSKDIVEGDKFASGDPTLRSAGYDSVEVIKIDLASLTATIKLGQMPRIPPREPGLVGKVFGGVEAGGGGIIYIGGKIIKVPPSGPVTNLLQEVVRYLEIDISSNNAGAAYAGQRAALEAIIPQLRSLYAEAEEISESPPGYAEKRLNYLKARPAKLRRSSNH